jgi:hypothetical protein
MNSTKFFIELKSFMENVSSDCRDLRASVDNQILPSEDSKYFASSWLDQTEEQIKSAEDEVRALNQLPGLRKESPTLENLLDLCRMLYQINEEQKEALEDRLEQYGYMRQKKKKGSSISRFSSTLSADFPFFFSLFAVNQPLAKKPSTATKTEFARHQSSVEVAGLSDTEEHPVHDAEPR